LANAVLDVDMLEKFVKLAARKAKIDTELAALVLRKLLDNNEKGLSDEDLEGLIGVRQGEIRKVLRLFYELRIASYRRGRHPETGATRYYWRINLNTINNVLLLRKKQVLRNLKIKLDYESRNTFYYCPYDGTRYTFDEAFEYNFQCPKCGSILEEYNTGRVRELLETLIAELERSIARDEERLARS